MKELSPFNFSFFYTGYDVAISQLIAMFSLKKLIRFLWESNTVRVVDYCHSHISHFTSRDSCQIPRLLLIWSKYSFCEKR
jgi:hypothetical protein